MQPVIALLTDFGSTDSYAGAMKAVISSRCEAPILDLTHDIPPFDVFAAAWYLRDIEPYLGDRPFIVVAVVDPGVGTARQILALIRQAGKTRHVFLAPDNGLLSFIVRPTDLIHAVTRGDMFLRNGSHTFHGRDRFAPLAAALAGGADPTALGPSVDPNEVIRLQYQAPSPAKGKTFGHVISIDRFGNIITDLVAPKASNRIALTVRGKTITNSAENYEGGRRFQGPFLITGSRGTLEISIAGGSAAAELQIARLDPVEMQQKS